jgi:hypothetical protein
MPHPPTPPISLNLPYPILVPTRPHIPEPTPPNSHYPSMAATRPPPADFRQCHPPQPITHLWPPRFPSESTLPYVASHLSPTRRSFVGFRLSGAWLTHLQIPTSAPQQVFVSCRLRLVVGAGVCHNTKNLMRRQHATKQTCTFNVRWLCLQLRGGQALAVVGLGHCVTIIYQ